MDFLYCLFIGERESYFKNTLSNKRERFSTFWFLYRRRTVAASAEVRFGHSRWCRSSKRHNLGNSRARERWSWRQNGAIGAKSAPGRQLTSMHTGDRGEKNLLNRTESHNAHQLIYFARIVEDICIFGSKSAFLTVKMQTVRVRVHGWKSSRYGWTAPNLTWHLKFGNNVRLHRINFFQYITITNNINKYVCFLIILLLENTYICIEYFKIFI